MVKLDGFKLTGKKLEQNFTSDNLEYVNLNSLGKIKKQNV